MKAETANPTVSNWSTRMSSTDKWEFYKDNASEWRWRRTAVNGQIVGASSEGYKNRLDCVANARRHGYTGN